VVGVSACEGTFSVLSRQLAILLLEVVREMRGVAQTAAVSDLGDRARRLRRIAQQLPAARQPALEQELPQRCAFFRQQLIGMARTPMPAAAAIASRVSSGSASCESKRPADETSARRSTNPPSMIAITSSKCSRRAASPIALKWPMWSGIAAMNPEQAPASPTCGSIRRARSFPQ
jgi:hypothetical protein